MEKNQDRSGESGSVSTETYFTQREYTIIEALKTKTIKEVAIELGVKRGAIDSALNSIRDKIDKSRNTANTANNWLDSGKNPRLAKLLRRQK